MPLNSFEINYKDQKISVASVEKEGETYYLVNLPTPVTLTLDVTTTHMPIWKIVEGAHEDPQGLGEAITNAERVM